MANNPLEQLVGRLVVWKQTDAGTPRFGVVRIVLGTVVTVQLDGADAQSFSVSAFKASDGHPAALRLHEFEPGDQIATVAGVRGVVMARKIRSTDRVPSIRTDLCIRPC